MQEISTYWSPSQRHAALSHLEAYLPKVPAYAGARNFVLNEPTTSTLSACLRRRLITEDEVIDRVLKGHSFEVAEKFLQEVVWRTYWKGWLEKREYVWEDYVAFLQSEGYPEEPQMRERITRATTSSTGLAAFDDWTEQLRRTGYLHNHVRMWWASIWIFTLGLPWQLGARFFLEQLLDGDPASNTLSWRWVAGLQTKGKHYLARAENIERFTKGRVVVPPGSLNEEASALEYSESTPKESAAQPYGVPTLDRETDGLLLHPEDLSIESVVGSKITPKMLLVMANVETPGHTMAEQVARFEDACVRDCIERITALWPKMKVIRLTKRSEVCSVVAELGLRKIAVMRAFCGFVKAELSLIERELVDAGVSLRYVEREYDVSYLPLANKGFFPFWEKAARTLRHRGKQVRGNAG